MEKDLLKNVFSDTIIEKKPELELLFGLYDLANEMKREYDEKFEQVKKKILAENAFTFAEDDNRGHNFKKGDVINEPFYDFLMSEEDMASYNKICDAEYLRLGLIDENGYFTSNVRELSTKAFRILIDFIIDECIPEELRESFVNVRSNIVQANKVLTLFRQIIK